MTDVLSRSQQDALVEIMGNALGAGGSTLSILLNRQVDIRQPRTRVITPVDMSGILSGPAVAVEIHFEIQGALVNIFYFVKEDAARITDLMMGGEGSPPDFEIDELRQSAMSEAVNQMMGMAANGLTGAYGVKVDISPPVTSVVENPAGLTLPADFGSGPWVLITSGFEIEGLLQSELLQVMPVSDAIRLTERLAPANQGSTPAGQMADIVDPRNIAAAIPHVPAPPLSGSRPDAAAQDLASTFGVPLGPSAPASQGFPQGSPQGYPQQGAPMREPPAVHPAQFAPLTAGMGSPQAPSSLDLILDVPLKVTVELGRTRMQIREVLDLANGSVVELDKLAGEPVDLLVNGKLIARGEVVVIDENFGIRVTDIVSQAERLSGFRKADI
ncbi:MAG: flagellar motor switch phosphatase FliY [Candidatus Sericytochromatia bacterium]|nr:flagellar motor switch phosphatase FliY [Candidatus Sericytochromatia bacterium]